MTAWREVERIESRLWSVRREGETLERTKSLEGQVARLVARGADVDRRVETALRNLR